MLEETLAALEAGTRAFATSSGMAAIQLVFSILKPGDELVALDDLYGGDFCYFEYLKEHVGITVKLWDGQRIDDLVAQLTDRTRLVWLETPSNPLMKTVAIPAVAKAVHDAQPATLVVVDNTFLTPIYQQPLKAGADLVVHSATKYLSGHNDLLGGVLVVKDERLAEEYYNYALTTGDNLGSFDSWLLLRSLKTLAVRMKQHTAGARYLADRLQKLPEVTEVRYPGVGGMLSFTLQNEDQVARLLDHLHLITFAESLGGVESLITIPFYQTHADLPEEVRLQRGITPCLVRLSVGLEDPAELLEDVVQALAAPEED